MTSVLIRRRTFEHKTKDTQEEYYVTTEAEIGMRHLQGKVCQGLPQSLKSRKSRKDPQLEPSRRKHDPDTLISDFQPPEL
jgi:hypothetical protein